MPRVASFSFSLICSSAMQFSSASQSMVGTSTSSILFKLELYLLQSSQFISSLAGEIVVSCPLFKVQMFALHQLLSHIGSFRTTFLLAHHFSQCPFHYVCDHRFIMDCQTYLLLSIFYQLCATPREKPELQSETEGQVVHGSLWKAGKEQTWSNFLSSSTVPGQGGILQRKGQSFPSNMSRPLVIILST